jgi:hypothetical protein
MAQAASLTFSQTSGTGTWTISGSNSNSGTLAFTSFAASRVFTGVETNPSFAWASTGRNAWALIALAPDGGSAASIDAEATLLVASTAATSFTANPATAAGSGEVSVILAAADASAVGTSAITIAAPTGWTTAATAHTSQVGSASKESNFAGIAWQTGVSGTVTPGAMTLEGGSSATGTVVANAYHWLITEAPLPPSRVIPGQAVKRAAFY